MKQLELKKVIVASLFVAIGLILPFVTGGNRELGNALSPMHIPVLIAGLVLGYKYGFIVGLVTPPLRFLLFGMPPLFPIGLAMMFELAAYGLFIGLFYKLLAKKDVNIMISLVLAMLVGRGVWGLAAWLFYPLAGFNFSLKIFLTTAFVTGLPAIAIQLILIPILIIKLRDSGQLAKINEDFQEEV